MRSEVACPAQGFQIKSGHDPPVLERGVSRVITCSLPYPNDDLNMPKTLTVLITGCSEGGVGFELAREFHRRGMSKVVHSTLSSHVYLAKDTRS
jgi:hypothetical protein